MTAPDGPAVRIGRGYLDVETRVDRDSLRRSADEAVGSLGDAFAGRGDEAAGRFTRDAQGRLRDDRGKFARAGVDLGDGISDGLRQGLFAGSGSISSLLTQTGRALTSLPATGMFVLAGGAAAAGAALHVIPPALTAIAGGLGAIPGLATTAMVSLSTVALGFFGVGDAISEVFTPKIKAGGAAVDQTAAAERRYSASLREEKAAQEALGRARQEATRDLRDMAVALGLARLDERDAVRALEDAERELERQRRRNSSADKIAEYQDAVDRARLSLEQTRNRVADLTVDQQRAAAAGVEGSDRVRAALDRQRSAADSVRDAHEGLTRAAVSGGAAVERAYDKLTPSAKKFVDELGRQREELVRIQKLAQERIFRGLDTEFRDWSEQILPRASRQVRIFGDDWNEFFRRTLRATSNPEFLDQIEKFLDVADGLFDRFNGEAVDNLVGLWGDLTEAAAPFVDVLGNQLLDDLDEFASWIDENAKDGDLEKFFEDAAVQAKALWDVGKNVVAIVGKIVDIALDRPSGEQSGLETAVEGLRDFSEWLSTPEGRETVQGWIEDLKTFASSVGEVSSAVMTLEPVMSFIAGFHRNQWQGMADVSDEVLAFLVQTVRTTANLILGQYEMLLIGAEKAFGWIPGVDDKLRDARAAFNTFRDDVNRALGGMRDKKITVEVELKRLNYTAAEVQAGIFHGMSEGGWVEGVGTSTSDSNLRALSDKEFVVKASSAESLSDAFGPGFLTALNDHGSAAFPGAMTRMVGTAAPVASTPQPAMAAAAGAAPITVLVLADFGDGVRQVVRGEIVRDPALIAAATDEGRRQRGFIHSPRARD